MFSIRNSLAVAILALAGAASGCGKEKVGIRVNCTVPTTAAVECEVKQTTGTSEVEACWDFEVECANGAMVTAPRTCQKVKDGKTEKVTITRDKLTNAESCGGAGAPKAVVSELTINGKQAE